MKPANLISWLICALLSLTLFACDDDTAAVGSTLMPSTDAVTTDNGTFAFTTRTVQIDSVLANTNECYLGCVVDPETRAKTTCSFLAQFHINDGLAFPNKEKMCYTSDGLLCLDSCDLRIYFEDYYGDSLTTMKLRVRELSTERIMEEGSTYYTNLDPTKYLPTGESRFDKTLTYAVKDLSRPDSATNGSTYYRSVVVKLPVEYGRQLVQAYYDTPQNFSNSYRFIHNVCPGFFFECVGGVGSMIHTKYMALNLYFPYHTRTDEGTDTIVDGMQRMGATEEVIQNTHIETAIPQEMLDPTLPYTYLKSPCGLVTEVALPAAEILAGEHYTDSINLARVNFRRHQITSDAEALPLPEAVLMVRKSKMNEFFEKGELPNSVTSYLTTFTTSVGVYQFSNIASLFNTLRAERDELSGVLPTDSEAQREAKYAEWAQTAEGQDWNKVYLVPVTAQYATTTSALGLSSQVLLRVRPAHGLSTLRLEGGQDSACQLDVIYSRFVK